MDGVASLFKVISSRFVSAVFNARKVFFEASFKGASSFTEVELSAFGAMNDVYNVVILCYVLLPCLVLIGQLIQAASC